MPGSSFVEGDAIGFERLADGLIECNFGVRVIGHGLDLGFLIGGQIALRLHNYGNGGFAEFEPVGLRLERLLREYARGDGRLVAGTDRSKPSIV